MPNLLAKKWVSANPVPEEYTLIAHLKKAQSIAETLCNKFASKILATLCLDEKVWGDRFYKSLSVAGKFHDIGKANNQFQEIMRGKRSPVTQAIRHEFISAILVLPNHPLHDAFLKELFCDSFTDPLVRATLGGIMGHHGKMDASWEQAARGLQGGCEQEVRVLVNHPELAQFYRILVEDPLVISLVQSDSNYFENVYRRVFLRINAEWVMFLNDEPEWARFAGAVKALIAAIDVLASALPYNNSGERWLEATLSKVLDDKVVDQVIQERLKGQALRPFQYEMGAANSRITLVQAGCGTGKTVGAYAWAKRHACGRKLYFCYPTTGTATEGYLGYVASNSVEANLLHSRAELDLEAIQPNGDEDQTEARIRIESLKSWDSRINVCTVDTVLGLVRNLRKGRYSSPSLFTASFVFDEVHAYDNRMFSGLVALMDALPGASFLLMSASLPRHRVEFLKKHFTETKIINSPKKLEEIPRYQFEEKKGDVLLDVQGWVNEGKKVLWVVNTVTEAQTVFTRAKKMSISCLVYHSRFRYMDRVVRHRGAIDAFKGSKGVLVIATQVAEMSLDLDADVLVTEIAPISSLIQRLGRLNRRVTPNNPQLPRLAIFIEPKSNLPYCSTELEKARIWVKKLISCKSALSQRNLINLFLELDDSFCEQLDTNCEWLEQGLFSEPGTVRDLGYTVQILLSSDFEIVKHNKVESLKRTIPFSYRDAMRFWKSWKHYLVAPEESIDYNEERGAVLLLD